MSDSFHVFVAIPSHGAWSPNFGISLALMSIAFMKHRVADYQSQLISIGNKRTSILTNSRNGLVKDAQKAKATHILFVDADQVCPASTIHRLAKHHKLAVGCNVATKLMPPDTRPTARNKDDKWWGGTPVYTRSDSKGLEKVWRLGTGVMLFDMQVFEEIPKPWFQLKYREDVEEDTGEDWIFAEKLEAAGIDIWLDHDLSKGVGHVGEAIYTHDEVELSLQMLEQQNKPQIVLPEMKLVKG